MSSELDRVQAEIAAIRAQLDQEADDEFDVGRSNKRAKTSKRKAQTPASAAMAKKLALQAEIDKVNREIAKEERAAKQVENLDDIKLQQDIEKLEREMQLKKKLLAAKKAATASSNDANKLYCVCRKPYDDKQAMLACDDCQEWFHLMCVGLYTSEMHCIESYLCRECAKKKRKTTHIKRYKSELTMMQEINSMDVVMVRAEITLVKDELQHLQGLEVAAMQERLAALQNQEI
mmetsp:Transcript_21924/g.43532  ORF Transcript_21924/g.43532 Transcript_21924/m.43532 type:complete len:233 (+) Transcript_21924:23-721(+)|eukprot:CAMPEP_0175142048 /NCGR_PEP_ID=MMETSP0087-20121206/12525_1 /TAXON_ID=136419 /ORGANISM="Unknown Unknown, Strain D1" /LENGTH=232 /DNA_ID=CAMNT_0016425693 /DNA_START=26 /DNA_END=724 /DNA_ORIENTATION=+